MFSLLRLSLKEILSMSDDGPTVYSDHSQISALLISDTLAWTLPSEKLIGVQEIIFWSSEWVGKTWTSRFKGEKIVEAEWTA